MAAKYNLNGLIRLVSHPLVSDVSQNQWHLYKMLKMLPS